VRRRLWQTARYALIAAVTAAVVLTLRGLDTDAVRLLLTARSAPYLALATAATLVATWLGLVGWRVLLTDLPRGPAYRIFAAALLTKYLPGRLWALATHVQMGGKAGIGAGRMASAFLLSFSVQMLAAATLSVAAAPAYLGEDSWWLAAPIGVLAVFFVRPHLIGQAYTLAARLLRRPPADAAAVVPAAALRWSIAIGLGFWALYGVQLWALAVLLGADPGPALPVCLGSFAFASLVGILAFFVPDGWGAREITLAAALSSILPAPAAALAAVASRAVNVLTELAISGIVLLATSARRRAEAPTPLAATAPEAPQGSSALSSRHG
jgi:hypothetical protein